MESMEVNGELIIGYRSKYRLSEHQIRNAPIRSVERLCRWLQVPSSGGTETLLQRLIEAGIARPKLDMSYWI